MRFSPSPSTGKERDEETGYGYFGARYMDHELMTMWLSVDPMADKYPGISPYAYCAWNPVKLVDPDGKDVWELSKDGSLVWKEQSELDIIKASDGSSVIVTKGVLSRGSNGERGCDHRREDGPYMLSFNTEMENAFEVFEFLADHSNIEYSLFEVNELDGSNFYLTTSFQEDKDDWGCEQATICLNQNSLISHYHNHPSGSLQQSFDKDVPSFIGTQVNAYIYVPEERNTAKSLKHGGYKRYHTANALKMTPDITISKMTIDKDGKTYKYSKP